MDSYADYLQKLSDLIARDEEINLPSFNHNSLAEIQHTSLLLDRVIDFVSKTNTDFNNPLLISHSSEEMVRSELFLEFQKLIADRDKTRVEQLKEQEEVEKQEEDSHVSNIDKEHESQKENYNFNKDIEKTVIEFEEVPFTASYGVSKTGVDKYGLDVYGKIAVEPFETAKPIISVIEIQSVVLDSAKVKLTGTDSYSIDIYGGQAIELFILDSSDTEQESSSNEPKTEQDDLEESLDSEESKLPQQESDTNVVTIKNTPISSDELEALSQSAREQDKDDRDLNREDSYEEQEQTEEQTATYVPKNYPKDIQDTDKIVDLLSRAEKKIGGFFRGLSKKD